MGMRLGRDEGTFELTLMLKGLQKKSFCPVCPCFKPQLLLMDGFTGSNPMKNANPLSK
jgi:hypothetical protein